MITPIRSTIFFIFCILYTYSNAQHYPFTHYTTEDGLSHQTVFHSLNDSKGYMWFATSAGVMRFDGDQWEHFTSENGLSDNDILKIYEDKRGRIWFLTFNGTLCYYYDDKFYNPENSQILELATINSGLSSVYEQEDGTKWFVPIDKDLFISINDFQVNHFDFPENIKAFKGFLFEQKEILYFMHNSRIYALKKSGFIEVNEPSFPAPYNHRAYFVDYPNNTLLYLSTKGLVLLNQESSEIVVPPKYLPPLTDLGMLYKDSKNAIWLSTQNNGVYKYANYKEADYSYHHFLKEEAISSIVEDEVGNMWFTTISNGVFKMPYNYTNTFILNKSHGLNTDRVFAITKDKDNTLWLGSENGFVYRYKNEQVTEIDLNDLFDKKTLVYNHIINIIIDENDVFVHTNNGIIYFEKQDSIEPKLILSFNGFNYSAKKIFKDKDGEITVSHTKGLSRLIKVADTYLMKAIDNVEHDRAQTHYVDHNNTLWYVNKKGVNRFIEQQEVLYNTDGFEIKQRIKDIRVLEDSTLILTTNGQGVLFYKNEKFLFRLTKKSGLSSDVLSKISIQGDTLWFLSTHGLDRLIYQNESIIEVETYQKHSGLPSNTINDFYLDSKTLYLASNIGLNVMSKNRDNLILDAPHVYIGTVYARDSLLDKDDIKLMKPDNHLKIQCSVINFNNQEDVSYQFRLLGLSEKWQNTQLKYFEFPSLKPGIYTFQYRAKRVNSDWSKPAILAFTVQVPFWEHPIIIFFWLLIAISMISTIIIRKSRTNDMNKLRAIEQVYKIKSLEQQALQAMMNPHFVFNVLNSIQYYLNTNESEKAQTNLTKFARVIRKNLEITKEKFISIEEEIEYLKLYLSLEKLRFDESFKYKITIDPEIDPIDTLIPTMLIQPFIENAIWHGIMPQEGKGEVFLNFIVKDEKSILIEIFDNGVGYKPDVSRNKSHKSVGLKMTEQRLQLMSEIYKKDFTMEILNITNKDEALSGTLVKIMVPIDLR